MKLLILTLITLILCSCTTVIPMAKPTLRDSVVLFAWKIIRLSDSTYTHFYLPKSHDTNRMYLIIFDSTLIK